MHRSEEDKKEHPKKDTNGLRMQTGLNTPNADKAKQECIERLSGTIDDLAKEYGPPQAHTLRFMASWIPDQKGLRVRVNEFSYLELVNLFSQIITSIDGTKNHTPDDRKKITGKDSRTLAFEYNILTDDWKFTENEFSYPELQIIFRVFNKSYQMKIV